MSTALSHVVHKGKIECHCRLPALLRGPEVDPSLSEAERLRERLDALNRLDAEFGGFASEAPASRTSSQVYRDARTLRRRLEAANAELYHSVRSEIVRGRPSTLLRWLQNSADQNGSGSPSPGQGFDWRDELVSDVFQLPEPSETDLHRLPEMVPYQPTPVRHILHLIAASLFSKDDVFVDLGSGLGHVPLLVFMLAGVQSVGIEVEAAYVASAKQCAEGLRLSRVQFVAEDARAADLSSGTVFYLYSPFTGSILKDVLSMLQKESTHRSIRICSLGPCTNTVANETWLKTNALPDTGRIAVFTSR